MLCLKPKYIRILFKKQTLLTLIMALVTLTAWAQTDLKVGTTPGSISPSAVLEAASTTKGFLIPRMTTAQMNAISSPANGLQIYNTTDGCIYIYRTSAWLSTCSPTYSMAWALLGNSGTVDGTNFIGTTDNIPLSIRVNNQKAGRISSTGATILGYQAGNTGIVDTSIFIGHQAGFSNSTTGSRNQFIGFQAGYSNTTGSQNQFDGYNAGYTNTSGSGNMIYGYRAGQNNTTGSNNSIFGSFAGNANTTGNNNLAIGYQAGQTNTTGTNLTLLGYNADVTTNNLTNAGAIGYNATVAASNSLVLGGMGTNAVNVGINTSTPQYKLDIDAQTGSAGNPLRLLGLNAGATSDSILTSNNGLVRRLAAGQFAWTLTGNTGTNGATNFIGTTDAQNLVFKTNGVQAMRINTDGNLGIGSTSQPIDTRLNVMGGDITLGTNALAMSVFPDSSRKIQIRGDRGDNTDDIRMYSYYPASDITHFRLNIGDQGNVYSDLFQVGSMSTSDKLWYPWSTTTAKGLGLGTINPQYKLDIDAQTGSTGNPLRLLGLNAGATSDSIISSNSGVLRRLSINQILANAWTLTGNTGTVDGTNFLGTTDNIPLSIRVNNQKAGRIDHLLNNAFYGYQAGNAITTGSNNSFVGQQAGFSSTTAQNNVANGYQSLYNNINAGRNVAIGNQALFTQSFSNAGTPWNSDNVAIGYQAMYTNQPTSGSGFNGSTTVAIGNFALKSNTVGYGNAAVGHNAMQANTTGYYQVALGESALATNTTGNYNTAIGRAALYANVSGSNNTALGSNTLGANTASDNIAIGSSAMYTNTTGTTNVVIGNSSLYTNTTGNNNVLVGNAILINSTNKSNNTSVGDSSLVNAVTDNNTALGYKAGASINSGGGNNTFVGASADASSSSVINATAIGYSAVVGASNSLVLGGTGANAVNVGMGTTTPLTKLDVVSSALSTTPTMNVTSTTAGINENIGTNYRTFAGAYMGYMGTAPSGSGGGQGPVIIAGADKSITFYTGASVAAPGNAWNPTSVENVPRMTILQFSGNTGIGTMTPQYKLDVDARTGSTGNPLRLLGLNAGATSDSIVSSNSGVLRRLSINQILSNAWNITGNAGTNAATNFIGTTDNIDLAFRTNNTEKARLTQDGYLGLGSNNPVARMHTINPSGWDSGNDYVFDDYSSNTTGSTIYLRRARGSQAAPLSVAIGDTLGRLAFDPYQSGAFSYSGGTHISSIYKGNGTDSKTNLIISTTNTERMVIDENGKMGLGTMTPNQQLEITAAMRMPATTNSTTGVIYKGANRFMHDYKPAANDGNNTFVGVNAGNFTMSSGTSWLASSNTGFGTNVLTALTEGGYNTAIGTNAMTANTTGSYNLGVGSYALAANTTGQGNTAVGHNTLTFATANNNTAVGNATLYKTTTGSANTGVGDSNLNKNTTGNLNTAVGQSTMKENTTGANNSALGVSALQINTTGNNNTSIGVSSLLANVTGNNNTAIGYDALVSTTSSNNVALGYSAGVTNTTGTSNTFVGYNTGATNTTGSNNTLLGYQANVSSATLTNATAIGNGAIVNANNKIRLGNTSITNVETYGSFTTISDRRLKNNVSDNNIGLNFIKAIRPVNYELKSQKGIVYDGFVAQEIDSILLKQGIKTFSGLSKPENTEGGYYTVSYATFVVPLVNAVKELDGVSEKLKVKSEKLAAENAVLKTELERLKAENAALKASTDKNSKDIESIKAQLGIRN